ncbi:MAG: DUF4167 domain-containing protein [Rhodoblastus sp.]
MRPGQNKRMRGRNNRKGPNPLTRTYESNGPDVKVRGTAQHIAEKYLQLARDAQSSGDPVMAESYLQHAEHYYRLIAAAMAAQQAQMPLQPGQPPRPAPEAELEDDEDDVVNDRFASVAERLPQPQFQQPQFTPPPGYQERQPYNGGGQPGQERQDARQEGRQDRQDGRQDRQDRPPRHERPYNDRNQQGQGFNRDNRRFRDQRPPVEAAGEARPQDETRGEAEAAVGLPAFITAPARPLPADAPQPDLPALSDGDEQQDPNGYHLRPRRRRRGRPAGMAEAEGGAAPAEAGAPSDGE